MSKVKLSANNIRHCRCPQCPVQVKSVCSSQNLEEMKKAPNVEELAPEKVPVVYCSIGKAGCSDLDPNQACMCPTCLVWDENNLQSMYYCVKGNADQIK